MTNWELQRGNRERISKGKLHGRKSTFEGPLARVLIWNWPSTDTSWPAECVKKKRRIPEEGFLICNAFSLNIPLHRATITHNLVCNLIVCNPDFSRENTIPADELPWIVRCSLPRSLVATDIDTSKKYQHEDSKHCNINNYRYFVSCNIHCVTCLCVGVSLVCYTRVYTYNEIYVRIFNRESEETSLELLFEDNGGSELAKVYFGMLSN